MLHIERSEFVLTQDMARHSKRCTRSLKSRLLVTSAWGVCKLPNPARLACNVQSLTSAQITFVFTFIVQRHLPDTLGIPCSRSHQSVFHDHWQFVEHPGNWPTSARPVMEKAGKDLQTKNGSGEPTQSWGYCLHPPTVLMWAEAPQDFDPGPLWSNRKVIPSPQY